MSLRARLLIVTVVLVASGLLVANLATYHENLSAAESRIRDTDMAFEMTTFTKLQVLQQSGVAMLGQANQAPNAVLSLIRG